MKSRLRKSPRSILSLLLILVLLSWASGAFAQLPLPASTQFAITGFLQEATLDTPADAHSGGTLKVNGHTVIVPRETIVIFPANALTWQELFVQAPAPWGIPGNPGVTALNGAGGTLVSAPTSGMAAADCANGGSPCVAPPLTTWEVNVIGNRVLGPPDQYIAGLIFVSQQGLNSGAGFINFIDYAKAEMRVGGIINDPACSPMTAACSGARVRINDPTGRYSTATVPGTTTLLSPDIRFTVDPDNPTIIAGTGYPMCLPRTAPVAGVTTDALCPEENRVIGGAVSTNILTNNLTNPNFPINTGFPNSTFQAPFEVGDYVTFAGTLVKDAPATGFVAGDGPTVGPWPTAGTAATYISAHTIVNNVSILTWQGSNPAYVMTEVTLIGTGGLTVLGAGEAVVRTRFEGMTTDTTRRIHLYGMDVDSAGNETDRDYGTIGVDPGPPNGAVTGRWRFRPPCLNFGTVPTKPDKQCVMNQAGTFLPVTREVRAVIEDFTGVQANPGFTATAANGLIYGQYHAPILEYIFPENVPGSPIVENNFNSIPFLACGGYKSSTGTLSGILNPWPSNVTPASSACTNFVAPPTSVVATATPASVISGTGTLVTLSATSSGTAPLTFAWTQLATDVPQVALTGANTATATFTTPVVAANTTLNFTVTVTNSAGSTTASVSVAVAVDQPIVNHVAPQTVFSGTAVTMNITGTDPGGLPLTFTVTQTSGPNPITPVGLTVTQNPPSGATAKFTLALSVGQPGVTLNFTIVAKNTAGASSAPEFTSVTVNPLADQIVIQTAQYRTGKQRIDLTVADNVVSPLVQLFLQPYLTESGTTYNPDPAAGGVGNLLTNTGAGTYTMTLVGAPRPACNLGGAYATPCSQRPLTVKSSLGGISAATALTNIRQ